MLNEKLQWHTDSNRWDVPHTPEAFQCKANCIPTQLLTLPCADLMKARARPAGDLSGSLLVVQLFTGCRTPAWLRCIAGTDTR